jgi:hypothetical protein
MAASLPSLCEEGSALPAIASLGMGDESCSKFQWHAESVLSVRGLVAFWACMWFCGIVPLQIFWQNSTRSRTFSCLHVHSWLSIWQPKEEYQPYMTAKRRISALYVCACLSTTIFPAQKIPPINTRCVNNTHARMIFSRPRDIFVSIWSQWTSIIH